jgi:signal peptidase I
MRLPAAHSLAKGRKAAGTLLPEVLMRELLRNNRGLLAFLLCFGLFRTALADWNPIPSGSMRPTLLEGDVVLVNRVAYDLKVPLTHYSVLRTGEPQRADIVTFYSPVDGARLIKRLVGLPGDRLEMRNEQLYINGAPAGISGASEVTETLGAGPVAALRATERLGGREHAIQVLPGLRARRDFGPLTVPAGSYFFLGDNRDNSADSRYIGFVPRELLIGRAHHILVSADIKGHWRPLFERFGMQI